MRFSKKKRMAVISLDGFPHSLMTHLVQDGVFSSICHGMPRDRLQPMRSVVPTVSSVAWSTYMSGVNPGGHGIFGFVDRDLKTFRLTLPNAADRHGSTIWEDLGKKDIPCIVVNVPVTYPPVPINGILIGGFLGVNLDSIVTPPELHRLLKDQGYIIDADTSTAASDPDGFLKQLAEIVQRRSDVFCCLLEQYPWQFAHLHIMETDRLFHFLWQHVAIPGSCYDGGIHAVFQAIDAAFARIVSTLEDSDEVVILSDHGFCEAVLEFDINAWLAQAGWFKWQGTGDPGLHRLAPGAQVYSLLPGRIYLMRNGREPGGSVNTVSAESITGQLIRDLEHMTIPGT
ncbi:alkaline phosphatase family protein, partial [bacterium]|nr:alkaline phosphatase family protein [candidate division CSSED10-310 bacterium]